MNLSRLFASILLRYKKNISVEEFSQLLSHNTFPLLFLVLALPSALPVPAIGYSTPFGVTIFILALQFLFNRPTPYLPNFIKKFQIPSAILQKAISPILVVSGFLDKRFPQNVSTNPRSPTVFVALLSLIMAVPIPFTNTIPAIVIALLSIAIIHRNKNILHIASAIAGFTIVTYSGLFYFAFVLGSSLLSKIFHS